MILGYTLRPGHTILDRSTAWHYGTGLSLTFLQNLGLLCRPEGRISAPAAMPICPHQSSTHDKTSSLIFSVDYSCRRRSKNTSVPAGQTKKGQDAKNRPFPLHCMPSAWIPLLFHILLDCASRDIPSYVHCVPM